MAYDGSLSPGFCCIGTEVTLIHVGWQKQIPHICLILSVFKLKNDQYDSISRLVCFHSLNNDNYK